MSRCRCNPNLNVLILTCLLNFSFFSSSSFGFLNLLNFKSIPFVRCDTHSTSSENYRDIECICALYIVAGVPGTLIQHIILPGSSGINLSTLVGQNAWLDRGWNRNIDHVRCTAPLAPHNLDNSQQISYLSSPPPASTRVLLSETIY